MAAGPCGIPRIIPIPCPDPSPVLLPQVLLTADTGWAPHSTGLMGGRTRATNTTQVDHTRELMSTDCCLICHKCWYRTHRHKLTTHLLALPCFKWLDLIGRPKIDQTFETISVCSCTCLWPCSHCAQIRSVSQIGS